MPPGSTDDFPNPPPDEAPVFTDVPEPRVETVADEVNATLTVLLPWGISLLLHAGVVLIAVFAVWTVVSAADNNDDIIPTLELSPTPDAPVVQETTTRIVTPTQQQAPTPTPAPQPTTTDTVDLSTQLVGLTGGANATPFGATLTGPQLQSAFMGIRGGNAKRIVFLIDCSGSLVDTLPDVVNELKKSIRNLSEQQRFTVIFFGSFGGNGIVEVPPGNLVAATAEQKQRVIAWIDLDAQNIRAQGSSNPVPALDQALSYRPELIYLLSDNILGEGPYQIAQDALLANIQRANRRQTKINTIQFLYPDPFTLANENNKGTLELIAEQSGGKYRFVGARELGRE